MTRVSGNVASLRTLCNGGRWPPYFLDFRKSGRSQSAPIVTSRECVSFSHRALHKESGTATQLDLKSAIANRQVRNKDMQYPQQLLWLIAHSC